MTLCRERLRQILLYDAETGAFTWRVRTSPTAAVGAIAGRIDFQGYRTIGIERRQYKAHRLAWLYMNGEWPKGFIDHIDGVKANNRWRNLREATAAVNAQNLQRSHADSFSGLLGAFRVKGRFESRIKKDGCTKYLGRFRTAQEAHAAYLSAKRELHEGNTL